MGTLCTDRCNLSQCIDQEESRRQEASGVPLRTEGCISVSELLSGLCVRRYRNHCSLSPARSHRYGEAAEGIRGAYPCPPRGCRNGFPEGTEGRRSYRDRGLQHTSYCHDDRSPCRRGKVPQSVVKRGIGLSWRAYKAAYSISGICPDSPMKSSSPCSKA